MSRDPHTVELRTIEKNIIEDNTILIFQTSVSLPTTYCRLKKQDSVTSHYWTVINIFIIYACYSIDFIFLRFQNTALKLELREKNVNNRR